MTAERPARRPDLTDQPSEPIFKAPAVTVILAASLPALFWIQTLLPDGGLALAFYPVSLWNGGWWPGLFSSMLIHSGWGHVAMNAVGVLAFAPPVARLIPGARGVPAFLLLYLVCGLAGAIGYALVHPDSPGALMGASGAVFGLMGAAIRLLGRREGRLRPLDDRRFLLMAAVIMGVNAAMGLIGLTPGLPAGVRVAWEAHAFGFVAGALLVGPWVRMFGAAPRSFDSPPDLRDPRA